MVDASYGSITDLARSHTGWLTWGLTGLIIFKSIVQKTVATSSSNAEMKAVFLAAKETLAVRGLTHEIFNRLGMEAEYSTLATLIMTDSSATVALTREPRNSEKSRHWLIAAQWLRQYQEYGHLRFAWIAGPHNPADLLTKVPVPKIWETWVNHLHESTWLATYIQELIREQLGVNFLTWEPPPFTAEIPSGYVPLPRLETLLQ